MTEWVIPFASGVIAGLVSAWGAYFLALRRDKEERRRERIISHLIEAYKNLEDATGRKPLPEEKKWRVESSLGAIFLFGSKEAADEAKRLTIEVAVGSGDMLSLLIILRRDLRNELGLEAHEVEPNFLRFDP
ncbi:hypothetical protein M3P21_13295 [Ruegeria sp. 2012CJ41-6]|uniref:Uncharacterized protein n=1 Tax=Ruegeria spongiae TaxID=2942209 RepID=A0ABT0Q3Q5_9RHOB|nr:hypothetical protein [Ruegeria spongiae]MCL6284504.1 hypothetical protein [Ruegeria spongiae]